MLSRPLLLVTVFGTLATLILSDTSVPSPSVFSPDLDDSDIEDAPVDDSDVQMDQEGRLFFNQLFNLSAALANRPNGTALTFVPLGSLLFSALG